MTYDGYKITIQLLTGNWVTDPDAYDLETSAARYIDQVNAILEEELPGIKFAWDVRHGAEGI